MRIVDRLNEARVQAAVILMLAAGGSFYYDYGYVYKAALPAIEADSVKIDQLKRDNEKVRASIGAMGMPRLERRIAEYLRIRQSIENLAPSADSAQDFLAVLNTSARNADVELASIRPDSITNVGQYVKRSWKVTARGQYEAVGRLLSNLGEQPRIVRPEHLHITPDIARASTTAPATTKRITTSPVKAVFVVEAVWRASAFDSLAASATVIPTFDAGSMNPIGASSSDPSAPSGPAGTSPATAAAAAGNIGIGQRRGLTGNATPTATDTSGRKTP